MSIQKIEIKVDPKSNSAKLLKRYMSEKEAFKNAVSTGKVSSFVKKSGIKFDTPISITK